MWGSITVLGALGLAGLFLAAPVGASEKSDESEDAQAPRAILAKLQQRDQRLQNVGWRLVRGNATFCEAVIPAIGLQLVDMAGYGGPETVRGSLRLSGDFAVQSAAHGSPAHRSGAFKAGREIVRIGDRNPNTWPAADRLDWKRLTRAHDRIDAELNAHGAVSIGFSDGSTTRVAAVPVCATRFEILGDTKRAMAEGSRVIIGERFPGFDWDEDDEFAGVVAHELAHNLLKHRAWLDRHGGESRRKRREVRLTEREADRLMPWLLANAGYDPTAAYRFMVRWGKRHDGGLFRMRTHDGWDERAEYIAAELPVIEELMAREGKADWSRWFRREIEPADGSAHSAQMAPSQ